MFTFLQIAVQTQNRCYGVLCRLVDKDTDRTEDFEFLVPGRSLGSPGVYFVSEVHHCCFKVQFVTGGF